MLGPALRKCPPIRKGDAAWGHDRCGKGAGGAGERPGTNRGSPLARGRSGSNPVPEIAGQTTRERLRRRGCFGARRNICVLRMALSPAFPARGYSVGDWGPHRACLAESGEAPTAGREPQGQSQQWIVGRSTYDLQHVDPLATRSQCVAAENAPPPQIRPGARVLPARRASPVWAHVSDDPH